MRSMKIFDSHCHLQLPQFDADRAEVLLRMQQEGVGAVVVGTDLESSRAGLALAKQHDFLWASVGLHPNDNLDEQFDISNYEELAKDPKVVAIGECGLDYFRTTGQGQRRRFEQQIELAQKINKALVVHCRNAHEDCSSILQNTRIADSVPVVVHFFTGSGELAQNYLDLGCYLSFPGPITYTDMYDDSIRICPIDKLLIETDAPFAAPVPNRGKRNEPAYIGDVARKIAALKEVPYEEVAAATLKNASSVFSL
jgi:TatD DNase family protein